MRIVLAATLLCTAVALPACGGGSDGPSDEDQIRSSVKDYANALSGEKPERLCDVLITKSLLSESGDKRKKDLDRCRSRARKQDFSGAPKPGAVKVTAVKVDGQKATAKVTAGPSGQSQSSSVPFRKVEGKWRILAGN